MHKKHLTRQRVQQRRQQRRRYPFDECTLLCQLFNSEYFDRLDRLGSELRPYLSADCLNMRRSRGLFLSPQSASQVKKQWLYRLIAEAISPDTDGISPLKVSRNVFFRYLSSAAHSNLGLSESTLKASVNKALS